MIPSSGREVWPTWVLTSSLLGVHHKLMFRLLPTSVPLCLGLTLTGDKCEAKASQSDRINIQNRNLTRHETETQPGIIRAAAQYGVARRIVDLCTFDVTRNPWRCGGLFDAIITDPPCRFLCCL